MIKPLLDGGTIVSAGARAIVTGGYQSLPKVEMPQNLKSSHVSVQVGKTNVVFSEGKGFGHGVGLSQWGAQGMAHRGHDFRKILAYYYPGAEVSRAYK